MKHFRLFDSEAEYAAYRDNADYLKPNISYCIDNDTVYYNANNSTSYVMVDLGLPSGTLWADRNVGATSPEDTGLYFQWGDTVGYTDEQIENGEKIFDWDHYFDTTDGGKTFNKYNINGGLKTLEASDDAATVNMGSEYRMPTEAEMTELQLYTTEKFIDLQGNEFTAEECALNNAIDTYNFKGVKLTSDSNGNSIFIPAAGYYEDSHNPRNLYFGYVWASDIRGNYNTGAECLYFSCHGGYLVDYTDRYMGNNVRAVQSKK